MCKGFGGEKGVRDNGLLSYLCEQPYQEVFGEVLYPTVYHKTAKFLDGFVRQQVFADGNKRTGFVVMMVYLGDNGIRLTMTPKEAYTFVMDVIKGKNPDIKAIAEVLEANSLVIPSETFDDLEAMENIHN